MQSTNLNRRCFSVNEVKIMYGLGRTTIYELINSGQLKTVTVGKRRLIPVSALDALDRNLTK